MYSIDSIMVEFFEYEKAYLPKGAKIALIGEDKQEITKNCLATRLKEMGLKVTHIYTDLNPFKVADGEKHDVLVSVRGCAAEEPVLASAIMYKKFYAVLPCGCGGLPAKLPKLVKKYDVPQLFTGAEMTMKRNKKHYSDCTWSVLHNFPQEQKQREEAAARMLQVFHFLLKR